MRTRGGVVDFGSRCGTRRLDPSSGAGSCRRQPRECTHRRTCSRTPRAPESSVPNRAIQTTTRTGRSCRGCGGVNDVANRSPCSGPPVPRRQELLIAGRAFRLTPRREPLAARASASTPRAGSWAAAPPFARPAFASASLVPARACSGCRTANGCPRRSSPSRPHPPPLGPRRRSQCRGSADLRWKGICTPNRVSDPASGTQGMRRFERGIAKERP